VPFSSVSPLAVRHTEPVMGWPFLIVLTAAPVPPETVPVSLIRELPFPAGHLPRVLTVANLTTPVVVPVPVHLIVMISVPDFAGFDLKLPPPFPPVAPVGVQPVSVAVSVVFTVFVVNAVHFPGGAAADAGMASGTAINEADAATITNARARTETLISFPFDRTTGRETLLRLAFRSLAGQPLAQTPHVRVRQHPSARRTMIGSSMQPSPHRGHRLETRKGNTQAKTRQRNNEMPTGTRPASSGM
jgi:hypothetical protein